MITRKQFQYFKYVSRNIYQLLFLGRMKKSSKTFHKSTPRRSLIISRGYLWFSTRRPSVLILRYRTEINVSTVDRITLFLNLSYFFTLTPMMISVTHSMNFYLIMWFLPSSFACSYIDSLGNRTAFGLVFCSVSSIAFSLADTANFTSCLRHFLQICVGSDDAFSQKSSIDQGIFLEYEADCAMLYRPSVAYNLRWSAARITLIAFKYECWIRGAKSRFSWSRIAIVKNC